MTKNTRMVLGILLSLASQCAIAQNPPQKADLGDCRLTSGSVIENCFVTYRVFGELNDARDNAILAPTWFGGKSEGWMSYLGSEAYIDTTEFFVIVADAFGNGSSSSPSNSASQSGADFPEVSIRDMVESHHRLLTEHLGISKLHAVIGISMGGMQAFEWSVAYPEFAALVVPVVGSPRLGAYDLYLWEGMLNAIDRNRGRPESQKETAADIAPLLLLVGSTPEKVDETQPSGADSVLAAMERQATTIDFENMAIQLKAMISHDISRHTDLDLAKAASLIKAKMLIVYSPDDHVVTPYPAETFSRLAGVQTLSVPSECGHGVTECEKKRIGQTIQAFLRGAD